jgi:hypothetical protein
MRVVLAGDEAEGRHGIHDLLQGIGGPVEEVAPAGAVARPEGRDRLPPEGLGEGALKVPVTGPAGDVPEGEGGREEEVVDVPPRGPVPRPGKAEVPGHPGEPARAPGRPDIDVPALSEPDLPETPDREGAGRIREDEGIDPLTRGSPRQP